VWAWPKFYIRTCLVLFIFATTWTTEKLGVHALFGAFVAEVMPKNDRFLTDLIDRIEYLSLALLLPLFFALTGLRVDLLTGRSPLVYGVAIIAIAAAGKLAGATFAARIVGADWKDSVALGVLMNTHGWKPRDKRSMPELDRTLALFGVDVLRSKTKTSRLTFHTQRTMHFRNSYQSCSETNSAVQREF
jgi:hypothetical protein